MKEARWQTLGALAVILFYSLYWGWMDAASDTEPVQLFARSMVLVHGLLFIGFALDFCALLFIEGLVWGGFVEIEKERS